MRRSLRCSVAALALWPVLTAAGGDGLPSATVGKPVTITAAPSSGRTEEPRLMQAIVSITGYHPAIDRLPVEVVVNGRVDGGTEQEVGRFGILPNSPFTASQAEAQRFRLTLPPSLATGEPVTFSIHLNPAMGTGEGASVEFGELELR